MAVRVEAVDKDVIWFQVGDEIFGSVMVGFAEQVCLQHVSFDPDSEFSSRIH